LEELVFTDARLEGDEQAKEFVSPFKVLLTRLATVRDGQVAVWQEEVSAQAAVAASDNHLDDFVHGLAKALLRGGGRRCEGAPILALLRQHAVVDHPPGPGKRSRAGARLGGFALQRTCATRCWNVGAWPRPRAAITGCARLPRLSTTSSQQLLVLFTKTESRGAG
jgi:hypothetical protein